MSETQEYRWWDVDSHSTGSYLDGKTGTVVAAEFKRDNYGGRGPERTVLSVTVRIPDVAEDKQPRPINFKAGDNWPSRDRVTRDVAGPFLQAGGKVDRKTVLSKFLKNLASTGFNMNRFADEGAEALVGSTFVWKGTTIDYGKIDGKQTEGNYDFPVELVSEGEGGAEAAPEDNTALVAALQAALNAALEETPEIPRGQLSIRLGKHLADFEGDRSKALAFLLQDSNLALFEGVSFDKKTIRKA